MSEVPLYFVSLAPRLLRKTFHVLTNMYYLPIRYIKRAPNVDDAGAKLLTLVDKLSVLIRANHQYVNRLNKLSKGLITCNL